MRGWQGPACSSCLASSLRKTNGELSLVEGVVKAEYVWFVPLLRRSVVLLFLILVLDS